MPKLSAYVEAVGSQPPSPWQQQQQQCGAVAGGSGGLAAAGLIERLPQQQQGQQPPTLPQTQQREQQQQGQQQQQQQLGGGTVPGLDPQHQAAAARLQADYANRLREHGPRAFRWPDGSLRPERPPPNPHAVATRRQWAPLVRHCRESGGDRAFERTGASLRHGLGVGHAQHAAYLSAIGLQPETTADGAWVGDVPGLAPPLQEPEHAFSTYYRQEAEKVFEDKLGRLL